MLKLLNFIKTLPINQRHEIFLILQICDVVVVSRLLNATLVVPEIQSTTSSKGIRCVGGCMCVLPVA